MGTTGQVIKNHLRSTFDKLGIRSRLEYLATHGGTGPRRHRLGIKQ